MRCGSALQGQYFVKQLSTQAELVGLQFNRTSTMNRYLYGGAFNFGYVPVYGKFALVQQLDRPLGDLGVGRRRRDVHRGHRRATRPTQLKAFKNTALTPNFGIGSRFFLRTG